MVITDKKYLQELSMKDTVHASCKNYLKETELEVFEVELGIVLPPVPSHDKGHILFGNGGVLDSEGTYIENSAQKAYGMKDRVYGSYDIQQYNMNYIEETVIYMNYFIQQWGHFLLDTIGRLWYILEANDSYKIVYTCNLGKNDVIAGNYMEFLELLGIDKSRLLMINSVTQFKKIIIPESAIYPGKYFTRKYKEIFDTVVRNAEVDMGQEKNIYCSRAKLTGNCSKKEEGESLLEEVFGLNGYESVYMEQLSLREQIKQLNLSKNIALASGSLAHNLLFLRNNAMAVILNKTYRLNVHQCMINQIAIAKVIFVDVYVSPLPVLYGCGPFILKVTKQFINFCAEYHLDTKDIVENSRLSLVEKIKYYCKWIYTYKGFLFRGIAIKESEQANSEKGYKVIRKYYHAQQRQLK